MNGKWHASNERNVYDSDWVKVFLYDVDLPDDTTVEHHFVQSGVGGAGALIHTEKGVLMMWRHRLVGDSWGWELPSGRIDEKEKPIQAAAREVLEETGWRPGPLEPLVKFQPCIGFLDHPTHAFYGSEATWEGPAADPNEAADIAWLPIPKVKELLKQGEIHDGLSIAALTWALSIGPLADAR